MLNHNTSEQKKVSMHLYGYSKTPMATVLWANMASLLSSPAMVEGSWLDLSRRNKPETQPFAHLTINATDIPSGKFYLHPAEKYFKSHLSAHLNTQTYSWPVTQILRALSS